MCTAVESHPTRHTQSLLRIVDGIYAAACGEIAWEQSLAEMCQAGRLGGCALSMVDRLERRRVVMASYGLIFAAEPKAMLDPMTSSPELKERVLRSPLGAHGHLPC